MSASRELIQTLATGVPGLDSVLGGGLAEYSLNLISGGPGCGKTTLTHQIMFGAASEERPALFFTVLGEPAVKLLRYQSQFDFFKPEMVGSSVQYLNLSAEAQQQDLSGVLDRITREVEQVRPGLIVVDSFRTVDAQMHHEGDRPGGMGMNRFVQQLALLLTSWEVTSFLVGEYTEQEQRHPVFTVADCVLWLSQATERSSVVRKLQVVKARGHAQMPGLHTFRITNGGLQIFPRIPERHRLRRTERPERHATGVPGLDEMMGGGIPVGDAVLITGPTGSGKTTFATQFAAEGIRQGEGVVVAVFEEFPEAYAARAGTRNESFQEGLAAGKMALIYLRPLDLSVDEMLGEILEAAERVDARRVVIDSLSGFEIALAPTFRQEFRESLYRLVGALTATGVTVLMTAETLDVQRDAPLTPEKVSFITDDIVVQRRVEIDGVLRQVLVVVKMRGSEHAREFRTFDIGPKGAVVGGPLQDYHDISSGSPVWRLRPPPAGYPGLTESEALVLDTLTRLGRAPLSLLATHTRLESTTLQDALERIIALGFATSEEVDDERTYSALSQHAG